MSEIQFQIKLNATTNAVEIAFQYSESRDSLEAQTLDAFADKVLDELNTLQLTRVVESGVVKLLLTTVAP